MNTLSFLLKYFKYLFNKDIIYLIASYSDKHLNKKKYRYVNYKLYKNSKYIDKYYISI